MNKLFITGGAGFIGSAFIRLALSEFSRCQITNFDSLIYAGNLDNLDGLSTERHRFVRGDICDREAVLLALDDGTDAIINFAAESHVDRSVHSADAFLRTNILGTQVLLDAVRERKARRFVQISTDYVFDGEKQGFYTQRDEPRPLSVYAKAKLAGERRATANCARTIVVRTGWIFGKGGRNFLSKVFDYASSGQTLKAINDSFGTPTYAPDLAQRLRELAELDLPGIYHTVNAGAGTSYEGFVQRALVLAKLQDVELESVSMNSLPRPAARPRNSRLRCLLSEAVNLPPLRNREDALDNFSLGFREAA